MILKISKCFTSFKSKDNPNLLDLFKPLHFILSLLGLFPYMIKYPRPDDPRVQPKSMILNATCASIMTVGLCVFLGVNIQFYLYLTRKVVLIINIGYITEAVTLISACIIAYISTFKNRKVYINILNGISTTWQEWCLLDVEDIIKYYKFHVQLVIFGWLSILVFLYGTTFSMLKSSQSLFKEKLYTMMPEIVLTSAVGFYYVLMVMVACLLKNIDQHIRNLDNERENEALDALERLEDAYRKTIEVKRNINKVFELLIAILLAQGFHATLRQAHGVYHALYHVKQKFYKMLVGILLISYPMSKLFAMSYTGTMLKNMKAKIGQSLHDIPVKEDDTKLFLAIHHFAKLIYYYETEIRIFGFFSLDSNLMFNMIASVVTYFVVLVQFDL